MDGSHPPPPPQPMRRSVSSSLKTSLSSAMNYPALAVGTGVTSSLQNPLLPPPPTRLDRQQRVINSAAPADGHKSPSRPSNTWQFDQHYLGRRPLARIHHTHLGPGKYHRAAAASAPTGRVHFKFNLFPSRQVATRPLPPSPEPAVSPLSAPHCPPQSLSQEGHRASVSTTERGKNLDCSSSEETRKSRRLFQIASTCRKK